MDANAPVTDTSSIPPASQFPPRWFKLAAVIPFLLSVGFHFAGVRAQEPAKGEPKPALVFDQYMVDRGPIGPQPHVFAHFVFHNRGTQPVRITGIEPSCGCMTSEFKNKKREYAPGESGEFDVTVRTTRETPGKKDYFVKLLYEDPQKREVDVSFRFILPEQQVHIEPAALIFYQNGEQATTQQIVVTDNRGTPLEVRDVTSTSELISAKIERVEDEPDGPRRTHILVTAAKDVPAGPGHRAVVALHTNDPRYAQMQVPLMIQRTGSAAPVVDRLVRIIPESLLFSLAGDKPAESEFVVTDVREKPLSIKDVRSSSPAVSARLIPEPGTDAEGHRQWRVAVTAAGELPPGRFRSVITIYTDDPDRPQLQVPVQVHIPEAAAIPSSQ